MSSPIRLHVAAPLHEGAHIDATAAQAHYLGTVMRRAAGDSVVLFNGADGEWQARIADMARGHARFAVAQRLRAQVADADLWLAFAPLKRDATELVVQKATELGVARIVPVLTARTNTPRVNTARLAAIAIEAAEQSERLTVPTIAAPVLLRLLLKDWPAERPLVVAAERQAAPGISPLPRAGLLVGPEGGFTPQELDVLRTCPFVHVASLGPRILRAETASLVGLALLQAPG